MTKMEDESAALYCYNKLINNILFLGLPQKSFSFTEMVTIPFYTSIYMYIVVYTYDVNAKIIK